MGARGSRAWGPCDGTRGGGGESGHGKGAWRDGVGRAGRAERAGMDWGPFKSSDRGMGPRGHGKGAWRGRVCGWWQPCETWGHKLNPLKECQNIHEVWVVAAMWDPGAMSWSRGRGHGGMGAMRWNGRSGRSGGESGKTMGLH